MSQEIKVYKATFEMYEGWGIREQGKSSLDLPDDFTDNEKQFVLLTDFDQALATKDAQIAVLEAKLKECMKQRDEQVDREFHHTQVNERDARIGILNLQLGRITIDSIKRGEK